MMAHGITHIEVDIFFTKGQEQIIVYHGGHHGNVEVSIPERNIEPHMMPYEVAYEDLLAIDIGDGE